MVEFDLQPRGPREVLQPPEEQEVPTHPWWVVLIEMVPKSGGFRNQVTVDIVDMQEMFAISTLLEHYQKRANSMKCEIVLALGETANTREEAELIQEKLLQSHNSWMAED